ncbi:MAG: hypothetical protein ABR574_07040 [Cryomorphaceae bacterium]|nr:hypothetical protein [Flavobacteriales bacterium]
MMRRTSNRLVLWGAGMLLSLSVMAQPEPDEGFDQTLIITGNRTLTVQKAYKISELPSVVDINSDQIELKYQLIPRRPITEIKLEQIEPAKVKVREPLEKLYHGYVKGGAGTFATPFLEASYTSTRKRDFAYGVRARHLSANDGINRPVAFSGFSENAAELWGKKVYKKHSLETALSYNRNAYHYYGFDPQDANIDKKDIKQAYSDISLNGKWKSYYRDSSRVNHTLYLNSYFLTDRYDASEVGVNVAADLESIRGNQFYTLNTGLDFIGYQSGELRPFDFMDDTSGTSLGSTDQNNAIFKAVPKILFAKGGLRAAVGLGIYGQFTNKARFHAFPDLEVSYSLFNNIFIPYAGMTGSVERNGFRTLSRDNPFILSNIRALENSVVRYKLFGGIRGTISDNLSFNLGASYQRVDDQVLYVNDTLVSSENRFDLIYDDVKTLTLKGEVTYRYGEKWSATVSGHVFSYSVENEEEAWHLPSHRFALKADYNLFDKFIIGGELAWVGKRMVKSYLPVDNIEPNEAGFTAIELDAYVDLSLSAEYRYTNRLSVFVEGHNLTATKYDIYYRFPTQRVFILGGAKYSF